jgi:hypothetical protein
MPHFNSTLADPDLLGALSTSINSNRIAPFFRERYFLDLLLIELFREIFQSSTCLKGLSSSDASAIAVRLLIGLRSQQGRLFCTHSKGSNFMWVPHLFIAGLSLPRNWIPTRTQPRFSTVLISSWYLGTRAAGIVGIAEVDWFTAGLVDIANDGCACWRTPYIR